MSFQQQQPNLVQLPDKVVKDAVAMLKAHGIDLGAWPGAFLTGGAACSVVQQKTMPDSSDLDFLVPDAWVDYQSYPIREWAKRMQCSMIVNPYGRGGACIHYEYDPARCHRLIQFFPINNVAETLESFDLAPCRVAISVDGAFCTADAKHAFDTGVCRNSCGTPDRLQKYEARGFKTAGLPATLVGREAWDKKAYANASFFLIELLGLSPRLGADGRPIPYQRLHFLSKQSPTNPPCEEATKVVPPECPPVSEPPVAHSPAVKHPHGGAVECVKHFFLHDRLSATATTMGVLLALVFLVMSGVLVDE